MHVYHCSESSKYYKIVHLKKVSCFWIMFTVFSLWIQTHHVFNGMYMQHSGIKSCSLNICSLNAGLKMEASWTRRLAEGQTAQPTSVPGCCQPCCYACLTKNTIQAAKIEIHLTWKWLIWKADIKNWEREDVLWGITLHKIIFPDFYSMK